MCNRSRLIGAIQRWISDRQAYTFAQYHADLEELRQFIEHASVVESTIIYGDGYQENKNLESNDVE